MYCKPLLRMTATPQQPSPLHAMSLVSSSSPAPQELEFELSHASQEKAALQAQLAELTQVQWSALSPVHSHLMCIRVHVHVHV